MKYIDNVKSEVDNERIPDSQEGVKEREIDISQEVVTHSKFMKRPRGRTPKNVIGFIIYILKVILLNLWILLGIFGGVFAVVLLHTPEGVIFGVVFGLIIGYILLRGN